MPALKLAMACVVLALFPPGLSAAECDGMTLARGLITDRVLDREPGAQITDAGGQAALVAFSEVLGGSGRTLVHRWLHNGELAAEIRLPVRGERWRTWSSKNLGLRRDNGWQVEILDETGCLLGVLSLSGEPAVSVAPVRALLEAGRLPDAKLALAKLVEQHPGQASTLQERIHPWIVLASARQEIAEDQLYLAASRLSALESGDPDLAEQRDRALADLARRKKTLDSEVALTLEAREMLAREKPMPCRLTERDVDAWLADENMATLSVMDRVSGRSRMELELLDSRTGTAHTLSLHCVSAPGQPD